MLPANSAFSKEVLPPLFDAKLIGVGKTGFTLRGFQNVDGASHLQEWVIEVE